MLIHGIVDRNTQLLAIPSRVGRDKARIKFHRNGNTFVLQSIEAMVLPPEDKYATPLGYLLATKDDRLYDPLKTEGSSSPYLFRRVDCTWVYLPTQLGEKLRELIADWLAGEKYLFGELDPDLSALYYVGILGSFCFKPLRLPFSDRCSVPPSKSCSCYRDGFALHELVSVDIPHTLTAYRYVKVVSGTNFGDSICSARPRKRDLSLMRALPSKDVIEAIETIQKKRNCDINRAAWLFSAFVASKHLDLLIFDGESLSYIPMAGLLEGMEEDEDYA